MMEYLKVALLIILFLVLLLSSFLYNGSVVVIRGGTARYPNLSDICKGTVQEALGNAAAVTSQFYLDKNAFIEKASPKRQAIPKPASSPTDAVIILTAMRSGSSVLGSIFNRRSDVTYLYEPLFPFGERPCSVLSKNRVEVLRHISRCQFEKIPPLYEKAFAYSGRNDAIARCKMHNLCFTTKTIKVSQFLTRDAGFCEIQDGLQVCPEPLDMSALSRYCKRSLLKAMKVIYLCKLEWLVPLLKDPHYNIKVVHLVRDPRATVKSRAFPRLFSSKLRQTSSTLCSQQLAPNIKYADTVLLQSSLRDKYLRIRFEDFAWDPMATVQKIYDFVDINMNEEIKKWIKESTSSQNDANLSSRFPQSTIRNSKAVLSQWREQLKIKDVLEIQKHCSQVIQELGYALYDNLGDLRNISSLHFQPKI